MKLSDLVVPEKNIRIHTEQQLREFERSVKMFGQIRPIVVDESKVILAGNGLYETLKRMGETEADVYQYSDLTEHQKKKLMIADNKIFSLGIENLNTLNEFLEDLHDDLDIPGYDSEILRQMVSEAEDVTEKIAEYGTLDDEEIRSMKENAEKKKQQIQQMEEKQTNNSESEETVSISIQKEETEDSEEITNIRKFVICSKCGEKIWL